MSQYVTEELRDKVYEARKKMKPRPIGMIIHWENGKQIGFTMRYDMELIE